MSAGHIAPVVFLQKRCTRSASPASVTDREIVRECSSSFAPVEGWAAAISFLPSLHAANSASAAHATPTILNMDRPFCPHRLVLRLGHDPEIGFGRFPAGRI